jgi:hypothetical protein
MERLGDWMQTYTGKMFWPLDPRVDEICIEDIAHSLSHQCRFAGHTEAFYSVAQHSLLVSRQRPLSLALWGLLHDSTEAYLIDLPRPLKRGSEMGWHYKVIENQLMEKICERFGLPTEEPPEVKHYDNVLLSTEQRDLMKKPPHPWFEREEPLPTKIHPLSPHEAELKFLHRFHELYDQSK